MVPEFGLAVIDASLPDRGATETDRQVVSEQVNRHEAIEEHNMGRFSFFGQGIPGVDPQELRGKLIVIEGTDGVGRSTQMRLLKEWLETTGRCPRYQDVRSILAGKGLREAKEGTTLGRVTMALFYATDFADRLENEVIPALRAGFVVLTDRYIYSLVARAIVRGIDPDWIRDVYGFALKPDTVYFSVQR